jgi:hypothetical protein
MGKTPHRLRTVVGIVLAGTTLAAVSAGAASFTATPPVESSALNPLAACPPDGAGINFPSAEVEPFVGVNPTNANNIVQVYQQDRYSNGGSKGTVASVSTNAGLTWTQVAVPADNRCTGGRFSRNSDPWVTFSPNGNVHVMSLATDPDPPTGAFGANGMIYNRSTTGGLTWEPPIVLIEDESGRWLNDKNSMTADPNDSNYVYAVWDRLQENGSSTHGGDNPLGFKGPIYFTRTTNGGTSWEEARKIYETGANKQTLGNQIVVRPQGELFDFFSDITNGSRRRGGIGPIQLSYIVSDDRGETWNKPTRVDDELPMTLFRPASTADLEPVPCPDPTQTGACPIRGGDLIPDVAVNRSNGTLYAVWMDARFSFFQTGSFLWDSIAYSQSLDNGQSWSPPIQVNLTPPGSVQNSQAFTPSVEIADDGTVAVTYYDFRFNTASPATLDTDFWANHCHPASENCADPASWNEETRVTPASFNIREAAFARGYFLGDYMGLASTSGNAFWSAFGSTVGGGPSSIFASRIHP